MTVNQLKTLKPGNKIRVIKDVPTYDSGHVYEVEGIIRDFTDYSVVHRPIQSVLAVKDMSYILFADEVELVE